MILTINVLRLPDMNVSPVPINVGIGGFTVNGVSNLSAGTSYVTTVTSGSTAEIQVQVAGYHVYNTFVQNVYVANKTIDIYLVPILDVDDPNFDIPTARFFYFSDPCTFKVDLYLASSFSPYTEWFVNNIYTGGGSYLRVDLCNPGFYQIKIKSTGYAYNPGGSLANWVRYHGVSDQGNTIPGIISNEQIYLNFDPNINYTETEYRPEILLEASTPIECLIAPCCYSRNEVVTITPTIVLHKSSGISYTLKWVVLDPTGAVVISTTVSLVDPAEPIDFTLQELGNYTVTATITDLDCNHAYSVELVVPTCNFVVPTYISCNTYKLENRSSETEITFSVAGLENNIIIPDTILEPLESSTFTFNRIGMYIVTVTYNGGETTEYYVLNNYCQLEDCIASYILDLLCKQPGNCTPCPEDVEINRLLLFYNTYFMKINKEYALNNFYTALENSKLAEFMTISKVMDKIEQYCSRRCVSETANVGAVGPVDPKLDWLRNTHVVNKGCGPIKQIKPNRDCGCTSRP